MGGPGHHQHAAWRAAGYVLPRVLAERTLPQLQAQIVPRAEDSLFWGSIRKLPADFSAAIASDHRHV